MSVNDPFYVNLAPTRGKGVQMQGAISSKQKLTMWRASKEGNNTGTFLRFVKSLSPWLVDKENALYVMDNASYHKNKGVRQYLEKRGISVMFMPAASPALNPIGK